MVPPCLYRCVLPSWRSRMIVVQAKWGLYQCIIYAAPSPGAVRILLVQSLLTLPILLADILAAPLHLPNAADTELAERRPQNAGKLLQCCQL
jgi:hypothetical protein